MKHANENILDFYSIFVCVRTILFRRSILFMCWVVIMTGARVSWLAVSHLRSKLRCFGKSCSTLLFKLSMSFTSFQKFQLGPVWNDTINL